MPQPPKNKPPPPMRRRYPQVLRRLRRRTYRCSCHQLRRRLRLRSKEGPKPEVSFNSPLRTRAATYLRERRTYEILRFHSGSIRSLPRTHIVSAIRRGPGEPLTSKQTWFSAGTGMRNGNLNSCAAHVPAFEGKTNRDGFKRTDDSAGRCQVWQARKGAMVGS